MGRSWIRPVLRLMAVATVLVALVLAGGWLWLRRGLPDYREPVALAGLSAPVTVERDAHAIPRLRAASMTDAYRVLGYLHAQDRLWQMELARRIGAGRLAEVVPAALAGDWVVRTDRLIRTLGLYRLAESSYQALAPEVRQALDAYAAGVNGFLANHHGPLPPEFQLLSYQPEPWKPADSLVWGKLQALQLSGNYREELLRARLLARLSPQELEDLFPAEQNPAPPTLALALAPSLAPSLAPPDLSPDTSPNPALARLFADVAAALPPALGPDQASNAWAIAGDRTTSGKPLLANDPHLGLQAPVLWYLARIETPELTLSGATVPGAPFHILGHNGTVAWGLTTTGSDTQDLFVERLDPAEPQRYLTPNGARPFETRKEVIRRRGQPDLAFTVRTTRHGPVLPEDSRATGLTLPAGQVLALAFTGLDGNDTTAEALFRLNRARNWDSFAAALRFYQAPQQNFFYADTGGTIGFYAPGRVPVRARGNGLLPVGGWTAAHDWTGFVPFDQLPHAVNPPAGRLVNANNAVVGPEYPWFLAAHWPDSNRAQRIHELLDQAGRISVSSAIAMQQDILSKPAARLLALVLPRPGRDTSVLSRTSQAAVTLLREWDGTMDRQRPEPLIFWWWLREFTKAMLAERLGPNFSEYWDLRPAMLEHVLTETPSWCDRPGAPGTRTCTDLLRLSLETTLRTLGERYGTNPRRWQWGSEHWAPLEHPLLGKVPLLRNLIGIGIATDGDGFTLNFGASRIADDEAPFTDIHGPGLRAVYDLANLDQSLFMTATGQSGNPLSRYYSDLVRSWRDGAALTLAPLPKGAIAASTTFTP